MPRFAIVLTFVLAAGCAAPVEPAYELTLRDGPLRCDASSGSCVDEKGAVVFGQHFRGRAHIRRAGAGPLEVFIRLRRAGGVRALLDMSLPLPGAGASAAPPRVRYEEATGQTKTFAAGRVTGRVEVGADPGCPCQTGRFELLLRDPGADGKLGTADDQLRRVSAGRLRRDDRPFCHRASMLALGVDGAADKGPAEGVLVIGLRACPVNARGGAGARAWTGQGWGSVGGWYDGDWDPPYSDGWDDGWPTDDGSDDSPGAPGSDDWSDDGSDDGSDDDIGDWSGSDGSDEGGGDSGGGDSGGDSGGSGDWDDWDDGSWDDGGDPDDGSDDDWP